MAVLKNMKGIFIHKAPESDLYLLIGRVEGIYDEGESFTVTVSYEIFNRIKQTEETTFTTIYFEDQKQRNDGRSLIPWSQIARGKNMQKGNVIATVVSFRWNDFSEAYGYAVNYSGIMWLGSEQDEKKSKNAVGGIVNWVQERFDQYGIPYLSIGLFLGYDRYGCPQTAVVQTRDKDLVTRCKMLLSPKNDGSRVSAWFKCGVPCRYKTKDGKTQEIYFAEDMTVTGIKNFKSSGGKTIEN